MHRFFKATSDADIAVETALIHLLHENSLDESTAILQKNKSQTNPPGFAAWRLSVGSVELPFQIETDRLRESLDEELCGLRHKLRTTNVREIR